MAKTLLEMWRPSIVESVCEVLADTSTGLTGGEIGRLLTKLGVPDIDPSSTKRHRLSNALLAQQQRHQAANCIVRFITEAMSPALHFNDPTRRQNLQDGLTERLSLMGLKILDDGRVAKASQTATTVDEAVRIAGRPRTKLVRRGTHPEVLRYCEEELVRRSIFHAVFEATKGLAASGCPPLTGLNNTWTARPVGHGESLYWDVGARLRADPAPAPAVARLGSVSMMR